MLTVEEIRDRLRKVFGEKEAETLAEVIFNAFVKASDFIELKNTVAELAEAQKKTTEQINKLIEAQRKTEERLNQLAEAQRRTEEGLNKLTERVNKLAERVDQLAEAQRKTEERLNKLTERVDKLTERVDQLAKRVDELAEAQRKTEERLNRFAQRVDELAEAQRKTEERLNRLAQRVDELAEAQRKTEERLNRLAERMEQLVEEHRETRRQLGGLAITVGYTLENEAYKALPKLLKKDFKITVKGKLKRQFVADKEGKYIEVNIFGSGVKNGKKITIIGESKAQLSGNDVDRFLRRKINRFKGVFDEILPIIVTHMISEPNVEEYAKRKGVKIYYSYEF